MGKKGILMDIKFAPTFEIAMVLRDEGYCPIECSFGSKGSVMDALCMDHHGSESWRVGVALRAYTEHFGVLREAFLKGEAKFVVTGAADADATFAIAALIGELPHPSRAAELEKAPPPVKASGTRDISALAALVNQVDTAPIGVRLEDSEEGKMLLLWNQMASGVQDASAFHSGVDRWRSLMGRPKTALLEAVQAEEAARVALARQAKVLRLSNSVTVVQSEAWGFDVWYADHSPVVVALAPNGNITIGCPNDGAAKDLFGPKGLLEVFPKLQPSGWGGREAIGGSPRGMKFSWEEAIEVGRLLVGWLLAVEEKY